MAMKLVSFVFAQTTNWIHVIMEPASSGSQMSGVNSIYNWCYTAVGVYEEDAPVKEVIMSQQTETAMCRTSRIPSYGAHPSTRVWITLPPVDTWSPPVSWIWIVLASTSPVISVDFTM